MRVTLKDVAARAGVSRSAVSRTFTEGASVSAEKRRRIERAAAELGYAPSALATGLSTGRTKLIGLVSNNFHNPIFLEIFDLFTRELQDRGLRPLLVNLSDETDPMNSVRMLRQYSVDGVIVASSTLPPSFAAHFREADIPTVHSFGRVGCTPNVHVVGVDNEDCGKIAARTLVARGYTSIAFLGGPRNATSTIDRLKGFLDEANRSSGLRVSTRFASAYTFDAGRKEMKSILAAGEPAEAYFCGDDVLSIGALSALTEAGFSVPQDVGLLGLNDMEMARWQNINLSTIRQPVPEIIDASVDLIAESVAEPAVKPEARIYPCRIIERGTLRPLP
ncbi:MAG: LacI family DNA-binding transcriptional regulator [Pseudomonadota bacterium]